MARLPQPGGDNGNWGDILNEYLSQSLKSDGGLKDNSVTSNTLAPNSVTNTALATDAVNATIIQDGSITEALLSSGLQAKINSAAGVTSVAGKTGAVTLAKGDVGLGNADNTSDADKPVSTAQQAAIDTRVEKRTGSTVLYAKNGAGEEVLLPYSSSATALTMMWRTNGGVTNVGEPTAASHAATKNYVDTSVGARVTGPASAADNTLAVYSGTTGKIVKESNIAYDAVQGLSAPAFKASGFVTTDTGLTYAGRYTRLATVNLFAQYREVHGVFTVAALNGGNQAGYAMVDLYVRQQAAMGSAPDFSIRVSDAFGMTADSFVAVATTTTASQSTVTLYGKPSYNYETWAIVPLMAAKKDPDTLANIQFYSTDGYIASLPAGTQYAAKYMVAQRQSRVITVNSTQNESDSILLVDASAGGVRVWAKDAVSQKGKTITLKKVDSSSNGVYFDPANSETVDGASENTFNTQWQSRSFYCDGTAWYVV